MRTDPVDIALGMTEAIRALTHSTAPTAAALHPADAADIVAALAQAAYRLPQLLAQLCSQLSAGQRAGRLRLDADAAARGPAEAVTGVAAHLGEASRSARAVAAELDAAHQVLAHLATKTSCETIGKETLSR